LLDHEVFKKVYRFIDEDLSDKVIPLMTDLIKLESYSEENGCEEAIANYLRNYFNSLGCDVALREVASGRPNVIASIGKKDGFTLMLNAHLDTVPPGNWHDNEPFQAVYKNGRIYGRGAVDMKGPITSCLLAFTSLVQFAKDSLKGRLVFTGVVGEEGSASIGTHEVLQNGPIPDCVIVCEPTNLDIAISQKGSATFNVSFKGLAAHSSQPEMGRNAIQLAADFISLHYRSFYKNFSHFRDPLLGMVSLVPVSIQGGGRNDTIPDSCSVKLNCRYPGKIKLKDIENYLINIAKNVCEKYDHCHFEVCQLTRELDWKLSEKVSFNALPFAISKNSLIVKILEKCIIEVTSRKPENIGVSYWSDAGIFGGLAKVPTVIFGPGQIEVAHGPKEYIELTQITTAAKILSSVVLRICGLKKIIA
jgi:acetylornithine deacetylase/succinyl-diaminopimelate desuccinylase